MMSTPKIQPSALNPRGITDDAHEDDAVKQAKQLLQYLDPILQDQRFVSFWKQFIGEKTIAQCKLALDISIDPAERERACFFHDFLKRLYEEPMKARDAALERLKQADVRVILRENAPPTVL